MRARLLCFFAAPFVLAALLAAAAAAAQGLETRRPAVLYDAPSTNTRALLILSGGHPVREISRSSGWRKVQTAEGDVGYLAATDTRQARRVVVAANRATVRAAPNAAAPPVFFVKRGVVLEALPAAEGAGGWAQVLHPDGESGHIESGLVWRNY